MRIEITKRTGFPLRRIEPAQGAQIVTTAQLAARKDADALVNTARRDAEVILADARAEARRIADEARTAADRQGSQRWAEAALSLSRERESAIASLQQEALALALEVARRIVGDVVENSIDVWTELIVRATERLRRDSRLVVHHAVCDSDRVHVAIDRLSAFREVVFEPDAALESGDCVAECAGVRVDARLSVQLAALERLLVDSAVVEHQS